MKKLIIALPVILVSVFFLSCSNAADESAAENSVQDVPAAETGKSAYTIEYYKQSLDGTFPADADETKTLHGTEGDDVCYTPESITGFTYDESLTTINGTAAVSAKITADGSTVVRLYYTRNTVTLMFDLQGGTFPVSAPGEELTGMYGEKNAVPLPEKAGCVFGGWNPSVPETFPAENGVYTAVWETEKYSIIYNMNGGTNDEDNPSEYTSESETITLSDPVQSGYSFAGWYSSADYAGAPVNKIEKGSAGIVTLYAEWTPDIYTITFHPNGSSGAKYTQEFTYGITQPLAVVAYSRKGYMFTGWNTDSNGTGISYADGADYTADTADGDLYAQWEIITYDIIYVLNGGINAPENPQNFTVAAETVTLSDPVRDGYTFCGWYTNSDFTGSKKKKIAKGTVGTITLYAEWTVSTNIY